MFSGLVFTSISTMVMGAALFQRKSRAGWLEELDGIREDALATPDGEVGDTMGDAETLWTDLREGGVYDDPHEISSLYADDQTPDQPVAKAAKASKSARPRRPKAAPAPSSESAAPAPAEASAPPPPAMPAGSSFAPAEVSDVPQSPDLAPAGAGLPAEPAPSLDPEQRPAPGDDLWGDAAPRPAAATAYESEQIWVEPAPHPIRPSEMWHPAELAPSPLGEETFEAPVAEERFDSSELLQDRLESELRFAADMMVADAPSARRDELPARQAEPPMVPADHRQPSQHGLLAGPVGRRNRRDRPSERRRSALPTVEAIAQVPVDPAARAAGSPVADAEAGPVAPSTDRGDRSPLPTQPLPPAALPSRANRFPAMGDLPSTPSAVSPGDLPPVGPSVGAPEVDDVPPAAPSVADAASPPVPVPEPVSEPEPVVEPEPVRAAEVLPLEVGADGIVAVEGMIVRAGGAGQRIDAAMVDHAPVVTIAEGWCWVSPGDAPVDEVVVVLPQARVRVPGRATALAVVEHDGSAFVIVADGSVGLQRTDDAVELERGSIAMVDPTGATQVDRASDDEIQSDPIVAENLSLDAEL